MNEVIVVGAAILSAVLGGLFLAFSAVVLPALGRTHPGTAHGVMQAINAVAPRSLLMVPLFGSPAACAFVAVEVMRGGAGGGPQLIGAVLGLAAFAVTVLANVPLNRRLDLVPVSDPAAPAAWDQYRRVWGRWNHLRTALALGASVALLW
ncbi:DUF1772 domain-containing protein [Ruania halotolerans]|uniref:anthrone oxygenase family protein n=1 Tax=Ruania halotolerans TaxID=2897773 RepID=UPI001E3E63BB|nr:anthrone oxygenase family protein [Ruania halotolerans]UFU05951.1 DUF1772 domain-containing protein [Ruania halotolerans]